jgi:DNA-binding beta-propeller fold protein YncE
MISRLARTAAVAVVASALTAGAASAATPSAYVYATSWNQTVRQYSADDAGALSDLAPSDVGGAGLTSISAAASPDGRTLYVVNQTSGTITQYDIGVDGTLALETPDPVATGSSPQGLAVAPDGRHVYVVNQGDRSVGVYAVDSAGALSLTSSAAAGRGAAQIALSPDGSSAYVTNLTDGTVSQFDIGVDGALSPKEPAALAAGARPSGIAVSADGASVYVTNQAASGTVSQFSAAPETGLLTRQAQPTVPAGSQPRGILAVAGRVYVANAGSDSVSQYAADAGGALGQLAPAAATVHTPFGLAFSPDGRSVYVAGFADGVVGQLDVAADGTLAAKSVPSVTANPNPVAVVAVKPRDEQAPTIDLRTPAEGAQFEQGADVRADYSCADDGGSGVESCRGDVPDGDPLDTATPGPHTFTVVARDGAGHETTVTHGYTVTAPPPEPSLGFEGFLGPIHDGSLVRAGDAIPIVFSLGGFQGNDVLAAGSPTSVQVACDDPGEPTGGDPASSASSRGLFFNRWTRHYVFLWQTSKAWAGTCRSFVLGLRDGSVERLTVSFRSGWHRHW